MPLRLPYSTAACSKLANSSACAHARWRHPESAVGCRVAPARRVSRTTQNASVDQDRYRLLVFPNHSLQ